MGKRYQIFIMDRKNTTVQIKQQEVFIGRPYGLPIRDYWQTVHKICLGTSVVVAIF